MSFFSKKPTTNESEKILEHEIIILPDKTK